jgi:CyaY protein
MWMHGGDVNTEAMGGKMEEKEFLVLADQTLARLEDVLDNLLDEGKVDFDYELKPGGIIEIAFADDSKIIVNRHAAAREIWVAARSGGFHFSPPADAGGRWLDARGGQDLAALLSSCFSAQAGVPLQLDW